MPFESSKWWKRTTEHSASRRHLRTFRRSTKLPSSTLASQRQVQTTGLCLLWESYIWQVITIFVFVGWDIHIDSNNMSYDVHAFPLWRQVHHECFYWHQHPYLGPERRSTGLHQHQPNDQFLCCRLPMWQVSVPTWWVCYRWLSCSAWLII